MCFLVLDNDLKKKDVKDGNYLLRPNWKKYTGNGKSGAYALKMW